MYVMNGKNGLTIKNKHCEGCHFSIFECPLIKENKNGDCTCSTCIIKMMRCAGCEEWEEWVETIEE